MGYIVGADQDHRDMRFHRQCPADLVVEVATLCTHRSKLLKVDTTIGPLGEAGREMCAGGLLDLSDAITGRARVTEQCHPDCEAGSSFAVPTSCIGGLAMGVSDGFARQSRFGGEYAVQGSAQQRQTATAERGGGSKFLGGSDLPHEANATDDS